MLYSKWEMRNTSFPPTLSFCFSSLGGGCGEGAKNEGRTSNFFFLIQVEVMDNSQIPVQINMINFATPEKNFNPKVIYFGFRIDKHLCRDFLPNYFLLKLI